MVKREFTMEKTNESGYDENPEPAVTTLCALF
jgi:hypothetical protein